MKELRFGLLTNALYWAGWLSLEEIADWALEHSFSALEIGPTFPADEEEYARVLKKGLSISDLIYCRNLLDPSEEIAQKHRDEVKRRIEIAGSLGIGVVTISAGIVTSIQGKIYDHYEAIRQLPVKSVESFVEVYEPLVRLAESRGVGLAIENCPLMGNWAISPHLWENIFGILDSKSLGLAYDPSHLVWQFMDPYEPLYRFKEKLLLIHAKDTEILHSVLAEKGILTDFSWWRYRVPGWGEIDWRRFLSILGETGYDGYVSIEHEDPLLGRSVEEVKKGILMGKAHLEWCNGSRL